jgi:hypothetical protein
VKSVIFNLFDAEEMKYGCKDSYPMTFANWQRLVTGPEFFYYGHLVSAVLLCPSAGLQGDRVASKEWLKLNLILDLS